MQASIPYTLKGGGKYMKTNNKLKLEIGDWVRGTTKNGELLHGYLENFQSDNTKVELKVVVSDNEQIIGNTLRLELKDVKKIENSFKYTEKQLENLIDLALSTRDQRWFKELSSELKIRRQNDKSLNEGNVIISISE
jgi:hypothetical protein